MSRDAIVIGAGLNGLIAGTLLAKAGWSVTVVERNAAPGGAIRTAEVTLPGFKHDLYATNINLFVGSQFFAEFGDQMGSQGFSVVGSSKPFGSVFPNGSFLGVSTDVEETLAQISAWSESDVQSWQELGAWFGKVAPTMFGVLGAQMPSSDVARVLWRERSVVRAEWRELLRLVLQSPRDLVEENFESPEVRALMAAWGMHLDFPPDMPGGALFPLVETFASAQNGIALASGGAGSLVDALVAMLRNAGGELETSAEVSEVVLRSGRAVGVRLTDGQILKAGRAVIANVSPRRLFETLVPGDTVDRDFRRKARRFRNAPGTLMIHLALDDLPDWSAGRHVREWCYVHIGPYLDDMGLAYTRAKAGQLPERPTLVVGQPTAIDKSRAPEGKHILWIQVRVLPGQIRSDATGAILATNWDEAKEAYADRVLDLLAEHAPDINDRVLGRYVQSPDDLERDNPNLVGGDQLGGSHHPAQNFLLRPFPGFSRYRTPVANLYMCGAGTWPGAGVGGGSGYLLGRELTAPRRRIRRFRQLS